MSENDKQSEIDRPEESKRPTIFINDVLKLLSGTTIASIILILSAPILTRYYSPEAFGFFAIFTSISSILIIIACLRYELAIVLPESDEMAVNLLALCFLINFVFSISLFFIIGFFSKEIATFLNIQAFEQYFWLIPVMVFLSALYETLNYWNTRTKKFHRLSITRVSYTGIMTATQIGAGYSGYGTGGSLIGANIVGIFTAASILGGQTFHDEKMFIKRYLNWDKIMEGFKRYKNFPIYSAPSSFISTLSWQLPVLLLSAYFSPIVVGLYALGFRVLQFPGYLIGSSISQVFFQRAVEANNENKLGILVEDIFRFLVSINLFPILILLFVGGDLFSFIFGPTWKEAGVYIQILSIWAFIWMLTSPLSAIFAVLEKQAYDFKINISILITRFFSLTIGGLLGNVYIALFLFAATGIIVYSFLLERILTFSHVNYKHIFKILIDHLILFIPMGIILSFLKIINANSLTIFIIVIIGLIGYYSFILNREPQLKVVLDQIKNKLSK